MTVGRTPRSSKPRSCSAAVPAVIELVSDRWTTPAMLALERRTVALAASGQPAGRGLANPDALAAAVGERPSLGADQRQALEAITGSGHGAELLIGPAGTGKTFMLDAARDAWQRSGRRVLGAGLAARAARELQLGSGIPSTIADRLLLLLDHGRKHFDDRTVLVVDEAGMLGTRRLAALVAEAASSRAKVLLVGDPRQLPEIDAGGLFAALARRLGQVELSENRRQRHPADREIAAALRNGQVAKAMTRLHRRGAVTTAESADRLRDGIVGEWLAARKAGRQVLMVAGRRSVVADLNARARELRIARGELGEDVLVLDDVCFAINDEVLANRNDRRLGVSNNDRGVLTGATDVGLVVRLDGGKEVELPFAYVEAGHLTHAYATTVHKSQGVTSDVVLVLGDDTFTNETAYTALTRGRLGSRLFLVATSAEEAHGRPPAHDPLASFTAAIARSGAKTAAIDHLERSALER